MFLLKVNFYHTLFGTIINLDGSWPKMKGNSTREMGISYHSSLAHQWIAGTTSIWCEVLIAGKKRLPENRGRGFVPHMRSDTHGFFAVKFTNPCFRALYGYSLPATGTRTSE